MHPKNASTLIALMVMAVAMPIGSWAQERCLLSPQPPTFSPAPGEDRLHALPHGQSSGHNAFHGQGLYGVNDLFLVHLPVFMGSPQSHPHNFQVILDVDLDDAESQAAYAAKRAQAPDALFTVTPVPFDQTALIVEYPGRQRIAHLPAGAIVEGHFEQGGTAILRDVGFDIERVVYFRELHLGGTKLDDQHYLVFGGGDDLFAAHLLSAPPDFDQILALGVTLEGAPSEPAAAQAREALARGLYLHLPDRSNQTATRLRGGHELACSFTAGPDLSPIAVRLKVRSEIYCEAGELSALVLEAFNQPASCAD